MKIFTFPLWGRVKTERLHKEIPGGITLPLLEGANTEKCSLLKYHIVNYYGP